MVLRADRHLHMASPPAVTGWSPARSRAGPTGHRVVPRDQEDAHPSAIVGRPAPERPQGDHGSGRRYPHDRCEGSVGAPVPAGSAAAFDGQGRDGEIPRWRRGWIQFRGAPTGAALKRVTLCVGILALTVPLFALATFLYHPHLRSVHALVGFFVVLAGVSLWNVRELKAQREARYDWFNPVWSVTATSAVIVEYGLFGLAVGIHGGVSSSCRARPSWWPYCWAISA